MKRLFFLFAAAICLMGCGSQKPLTETQYSLSVQKSLPFAQGRKTFGYVYVLQGETKQIPNGYHWDVTDHRHLLKTLSRF